MATIIEVDDLPAAIQSNELIDAMVSAANAKAARIAPCLISAEPAPTDDQLAEAKLILIGAVQRWTHAGSGALSQRTQTAGPYSNTETIDTRQRTGYNLWPSEITQLQDICKAGGNASAFSVDTAPPLCGAHLLWCSLNFGATYCSCGVDIAWFPIFETG